MFSFWCVVTHGETSLHFLKLEHLARISLLTTVDGEVERGLPALRDIVERRMYDHLRKQLPDLARVVQDAVEAVKLRLNQVARRAPLADATIAQGVVRARLGDQVYHKRRLDYLRREGDALQCKIKNLRLRAIREVDKGVNIGRKAENEELFEGSEVLVGVPGEEFLQAAVLTSVKGGSEVEYRLTAKTTTGMVARDKVWSTASGPERMVQDVRALAQELRGIRNLAHVDPQPIIEAYVTDWASRYETVLKEAARRVAASAKEWVDAWFSLDTLPVTTAPLVGALHEEMHARLAKLDTEALHAMARIVRYNRPPLVLTTNDHYLESVYRDLVGKDTEGASDDGAAKLLYYRVWAYWKVQVKVVVEVAVKDLFDVYLSMLDDAFEEVVAKFVADEYVSRVSAEPRSQQRERERLEASLGKLREAEQALSTV